MVRILCFMACRWLSALLRGARLFTFFTQRSEVSFLLAMTRSKWRRSGEGRKAQPNIAADTSVRQALSQRWIAQQKVTEPIVRMNGLSGAIKLADGPATIAAANGQYDMDSEKATVRWTGPGQGRRWRSYRCWNKAAGRPRYVWPAALGGVNGALNIGIFLPIRN